MHITVGIIHVKQINTTRIYLMDITVFYETNLWIWLPWLWPVGVQIRTYKLYYIQWKLYYIIIRFALINLQNKYITNAIISTKGKCSNTNWIKLLKFIFKMIWRWHDRHNLGMAGIKTNTAPSIEHWVKPKRYLLKIADK